jgi:type 1 fimbriae regulatory protein FimB/type 1 fimbriae regulatory protein FimE
MPNTRKKNKDYRSREFLHPEELKELLQAVSVRGRHQHRDYTLLLLMYRHGLRVTEAVTLRWDAISLKSKTIWVERLKGSDSSNHPLQDDEIETLTELKRLQPNSVWLFPSERGTHISTDAVRKLLNRASEIADIDVKVHPHMLRHACGYAMANKGYSTRKMQDYLGHRNISHTEKYTKLNANRFDDLTWDV